jgi:hypothetical protein
LSIGDVKHPSDAAVDPGGGGGGFRIGDVGRDLTITAEGDIVAGDKITIQYLVQQVPRDLAKAPYKFLTQYDVTDRDIFFGRDSVTEQLLELVRIHRLVLLNGQPGAGKSSLINAGLIPRLADKGYLYVRFREYADPVNQLREYFARQKEFDLGVSAAEMSVGDLFRAAKGRRQRVLVVLDQFERFFLTVQEEKRRAEFIDQLRECLTAADAWAPGDVNIIVAVREDYFGRLVSEFERTIPNLLRENYHVNLRPLDRSEARQAILNPLRGAPGGVSYDLAFVDTTLIPHLIGQPPADQVIEPSHLQIVCNRLYMEARKSVEAGKDEGMGVRIDAALYKRLDGASGILWGFLDEAVERVAARDPERAKVVRSILKLMIQSGDARKFISLADIRQALPDVSDLDAG